MQCGLCMIADHIARSSFKKTNRLAESKSVYFDVLQ